MGNNGVSQIALFVTPTSVDDLDFHEGIVTGPNYVATKKVTYGILTGYVTIQPATTGLEGMIVQVFDRKNGYLIKYEIVYTGADQKAKETAIKITQDILGNFKYQK